ncbi:MAG: sulfite exporter TauE/SafE family protein [Candidatus Eisenbacteria bacterium]|nr:sulfite exporter TauE/SafE family protein [Candidatus Eisenbacteria bacterium]
MLALVSTVLASALLGSPHCAAMCGGFVCFYSGQESGRSRWLAHAAYNGGRLVSYTALGAIAGLVGARVERLGATVGISRGAAILAGALMVAWGGAALLRALGVRLPGGLGETARGPVAAALRGLREQPPELRALALGLLSTLLPCGFLYAYVAIAAGTGSPWMGALAMAVFWAGTVPVMTGLGLVAQRALGPLRRHLPVATAGLLVVLGLLTMAGKLRPGLMTGSPKTDCCEQTHR